MKKLIVFFLLICTPALMFSQTNWNKHAKESAINADKKFFKNDTIVLIANEYYLSKQKETISKQIDSLYLILEKIRLQQQLFNTYHLINKP